MATGICAVLVHVPDMDEGLSWYRRAFPHAYPETSHPSGFAFLKIGETQLEIVAADEKVASGPAGSVVYWWVDDFEGALAHLTAVGATLYRGPLDIDGGLVMCQVRDPWGNCIGLRGPIREDRNSSGPPASPVQSATTARGPTVA